jgi:hypothetical protein
VTHTVRERIGTLFAICLCCIAVVDSAALAAPTGAITGSVYCSDSNSPARFALVTLEKVPEGNRAKSAQPQEAGMNPTATTDLHGNFELRDIPPGRYYVIPYLRGYASPVTSIDPKGAGPSAAPQSLADATVVEVEANHTAQIQIRLERAASISGTVSFDDSSPAIGMSVDIFRQAADGTFASIRNSLGGPSGIFRQINATDGSGRFLVDSLPEGHYVVAISTPTRTTGAMGSLLQGSGAFTLKAEYGDQLTVYTDQAMRMKDATPIELRAGSDFTGSNIVIPLAKLYTVAGFVLDAATEATVGRGFVQLLYTDDQSVARSTTIDPSGKFRFNAVPGGSYVVHVANASQFAGDPQQSGNQSVGLTYGSGQTSVQIDRDVLDIVVLVPELRK